MSHDPETILIGSSDKDTITTQDITEAEEKTEEAAEEIIEGATPVTKAKAELSIDKVSLKDVTIMYNDAVSGRNDTLIINNGALTTAVGGAVNVKANADYNGADVNVNADAASLKALIAQNVKVNATVKAPQSTMITWQGDISKNGEELGVSGKFEATGESLNALNSVAGLSLPASPAYNVSGNMQFAAKVLKIKQLVAAYGDYRVSGPVTVNMTKSKPYIVADLTSPAMTLGGTASKVSQFIDALPDIIASAHAADVAQTQRLIPNFPLPTAALKAVNADVKWSTPSITVPKLTMNGAKATINLKDNVLKIAPFSFTTSKGHITNYVTLSGASSPAQLALNIKAQNVNLGNLLASMGGGKSAVTGGNAGISLNLKGAGKDVHSVIATMDGDSSIIVDGAKFTSSNVDKAKAFLTFLGGSSGAVNTIDVACFFTAADIRNGVATTKALTLQTDAAQVDGKGSISLVNESMNITLIPRSTLLDTANLIPPIKLTGAWTKPNVSIDSDGALKSVASLALGSRLKGTGLAAIAGLDAANKLEAYANNPCVKQAQTPVESKPLDSKENLKALEDKVRTIRDTKKKELKELEGSVKSIRDAIKGKGSIEDALKGKDDLSGAINKLQGLF